MEYNYNTNQMCSFCAKYKKSCNGRDHEMYLLSINHYCPEFLDKNRINREQINKINLQTFSDWCIKNGTK